MSDFGTGDRDPKKVSNGRLVIWLMVGGLGAYLLISGILGIVT